ncbi:MAG: hypothetical protein C4320_09915 [Armatimonadota bacterium]
MKLAILIVHHRDKGRVTDALVKGGFKFTMIGSSGGFLREGSTTLLLGIEPAELDALRELVAENCQTREQMVSVGAFEAAQVATFAPGAVSVSVGGAVLFTLDVESFDRF